MGKLYEFESSELKRLQINLFCQTLDILVDSTVVIE